MPYNTNPIPPPEEYGGTTQLPLARVQKVIQADDDLVSCSKNAAFAIAVATEMFIYYIAEQSHSAAKADKRVTKRMITYKDVATAVASRDNLEFLTDVVPKTMTYKQYKQKKARQEKEKAEVPGTTNSQRTLQQMTKRTGNEDDVEMGEAEASNDTQVNGHSEGHVPQSDEEEGFPANDERNSRRSAGASASYDFDTQRWI